MGLSHLTVNIKDTDDKFFVEFGVASNSSVIITENIKDLKLNELYFDALTEKEFLNRKNKGDSVFKVAPPPLMLKNYALKSLNFFCPNNATIPIKSPTTSSPKILGIPCKIS